MLAMKPPGRRSGARSGGCSALPGPERPSVLSRGSHDRRTPGEEGDGKRKGEGVDGIGRKSESHLAVMGEEVVLTQASDSV